MKTEILEKEHLLAEVVSKIEKHANQGKGKWHFHSRVVHLRVTKEGLEVLYYIGSYNKRDIEEKHFFEGISVDDAQKIKLKLERLVIGNYLVYSKEIAIDVLEAFGCYDIEVKEHIHTHFYFKKLSANGDVVKANIQHAKAEEPSPFHFNKFMIWSEEDLDTAIRLYHDEMKPWIEAQKITLGSKKWW